METLTDHEKQALTEVLDDYICRLVMDGCTEASIKFHEGLAKKLDRILYSEDND